ncbi:MAG: hypothetical protein MJ209_04915 [archaeon]|nr:hypothetical protein [archaeon]
MFVVRLLQHNPYKEDSNVSPKWDSYNKINQNDKLKVNQNNYRISIIVSKLTKFLKPINHKLKSEDESSKQTFLNYMTNKCKNIFKILNDVFARNLSNKEESVNNTEEFRYSVRFIIVILICFTWDYINQNWMFTATLLSFFTLITNLIFNSEVFLLRVYATVMSIIIGLGILIIFDFFNILYLITPLSTLAFLLFFLLKDNGYITCLLFLLVFILWSPQGTIDTAILFAVNGAVSLIVIIFIFNIVMPKKSKPTNIIKLLSFKIDLTKKLIEESYNQGLEQNTLEKLRENDAEIITILNKLDNKYKNITEEIELFYNLNHLIEDFGHNVISIKLNFR